MHQKLHTARKLNSGLHENCRRNYSTLNLRASGHAEGRKTMASRKQTAKHQRPSALWPGPASDLRLSGGTEMTTNLML